MNFLVVLFEVFFVLHCTHASVVTDITSVVFSDAKDDILAAFGDFDADKLTDLFVITQKGSQVDILLADEKGKYYRRQTLLNITKDNERHITGVVPGDFDGDLQMDILITIEKTDGSSGSVELEIYWSQQTKNDITIHGPTRVLGKLTLTDQPLVLDWNADMIPDFIGETNPGNLSVWLGQKGVRNFSREQVSNETTLVSPHSNAFIDLDSDFAADLFLTTTKGFEAWYNVDGIISYNKTVPKPERYKYIGQISFADFDQDSKPDMILPVCEDSACKESKIIMYKNNKWEVIIDKFANGQETWGYVKPDKTKGVKQVFPVTLRMGDFNMDGYPDILTILQNSNNQAAAYLMINEECKEGACSHVGRTVSVQWDTKFSQVYGAVLAAFYDTYEDGILDVMLVAVTNNDKGEPMAHLRAYKNIFTGDACFIKITVVSGLCSKDCPDDRKPFGANQPGPSIKYKTVTPLGDPQTSCATQLSQSAHYALQLPYTIFGLGQTPNFVDNLWVGIPQQADSDTPMKREFTQIIPNSQLAVIPYPLEKPTSWLMHLYVTPSRQIYITGAALLGTCGFIAGIVGILQLRERREDKREKQQEAQKFHFDAM